jgi:tartrate dehydratase beta subunit/fumarate hydratase class I family protein
MINLSFPITEEKIRALKVGDEVLISGNVFTGRARGLPESFIGGRLAS